MMNSNRWWAAQRTSSGSWSRLSRIATNSRPSESRRPLAAALSWSRPAAASMGASRAPPWIERRRSGLTASAEIAILSTPAATRASARRGPMS